MPNLVKRFLLPCFMALTMGLSGLAQAGDALQRIIDFDVLKVGISMTQPPLNFTSRDGKPMGMDVDMAKAMAAAMKVRLEVVPLPFGDLMTALEDDKVDMVISGMSITPERTEMASFVGPYMMSGKSILTKKDTVATISSTEEVNRPTLKLAALRNSTSAAFIREVAPEAQLVEVEDYDDGVAMVMNDKADGMVADMPACALAILRYPNAGLTMLSEPLTVEPLGIAVSKDDAQFVNLIENYLDAYEKLGVVNKMRKKWLEDKSWVVALP
ncbi:MAG: transporter substrate-binding domain-containing protein [Pseudomonadota bacterium]